MGLFALEPFAAGDRICPARIGDQRTPAGRFCKHSTMPNTEMVATEHGDMELIALRPITAGEELVNDYYQNFIRSRSTLEPECQH